jgi:DivIVA protein
MSLFDRSQPFRYRRLGGGYRREDVEIALSEIHHTLQRLDNDLQMVRDRNRDLEGELSAARGEIESLRSKERALSQTMTGALNRAAEIEEGATGRAREIEDAANRRAHGLVAQADEEALRLRSEAARRLDEATAQLNELLRLKDYLLHAMRSFVRDFDEAVSRVERTGLPSLETLAPAFAAPPPPPPPPPPAPSPAPPDPVIDPVHGPLFESRVELDVGPFVDPIELSAFEHALVRVPKVVDVYVRRLADGRAFIELTLSEPAQLLRTMREMLPYSLEVRSVSQKRLVVDIAVRQAAGAT